MRIAQAVGLLAASLLVGQDAAQLRFEVVSIRPAAPITGRGEIVGGRRGGPGTDSPERISWRYVPVGYLVLAAYGVQQQRIVGPNWLFAFDPAFDIQATCRAEEGASRSAGGGSCGEGSDSELNSAGARSQL